ncbi:MAG TPA: hypothetical protein VFB38_02955 [Chthonomonadaceae bacterium]|nr:hypothetical protein [Chthonomonadaceae bacterium]
MLRARIGWLLVLLPCLFGSPARADHFAFRREVVNGQEQGIVVSHGMDLFVITTSAGGYSPARRAEIIARRLEQLTEDHSMEPEMFGVGSRNGEIILQQQEHPDHPPHILVTVDRRLARQGDAERLAQWWLALLRDNFSLAIGRKPVYTAGTPIGALFQKVYAALGEPTEPIPAEDIIRTVEALPESDRQAFRNAAASVPASFSPVANVTVPRKASPQHEEEDQGGDSAQEPARRSRPERATPPDENIESYRNGEEPASQPPSRVPRTQTRRPESAQANDALVQRSGHYKVTLLTDPKTIEIGQPTTIQIQLTDEDTGEESVPGATLRGWLAKRGQKSASSASAEFNERTGTYDLPLVFHSAGNYRLTVGILTESEDVFKVAYTLAIGRSDTTEDGKEELPNSERVASRNIRRIGLYECRLTVDPVPPVVGEEAEVEVHIRNTSRQAPLLNATVKGWFVAEGEDASEVEPRSGGATEEAGTYGWHVKFPKAGKYFATVSVETETGRKFRVRFPVAITVLESEREPNKDETDSTGKEPSAPEEPENSPEDRPSERP